MTKLLPLLFLVFGCSGERPKSIGTLDSIKLPCPASPNCVTSLHPQDEEHFMSPLKGVSLTHFQELVHRVEKRADAKIIKRNEGYLYAEFTSKLMKFVDDVEFSFDSTDKEIHFRSASRLGHSDLGVNEKRIKELTTGLVR